LNTITIGKQLINRIGRKATHPKIFTILSLRGAQATRQSSPNRPHKHRPPPCIRTSTTRCHCEPQSGAAIQSEPPPQASPTTMHTHLGPPPVIASHKVARQSSGISSIERIPRPYLQIERSSP
jgi:hypothetical protein